MPRLYAKLAILTYTTLLIVMLLAVLVTRFIGGADVAKAHAGVARNADWTPVVGTSPQGIAFVLVPAGCFDMGDPDDADIGAGGRQCFDAPFWISRYEISNAQYQGCVNVGACEPSFCAGDSEINGAQQPVVCVDWFQAGAFAAWAGARLPSEAAWEYAARGPDALSYPWGNGFDGTRLNFCDERCTYDWRDASVNDGYQHTAPGGSYSPAGDSWAGAADLAGNVWEWTATIYADYPYDAADGPEDENDRSASRVLRGGAWLNLQDNARAVYRYFQSSGRNLNVGFRVVVVAPTS